MNWTPAHLRGPSQKGIQHQQKALERTLQLIVQSLFHGESRLPRGKCASSAALSHVSHTDKLINSVWPLQLRLNLPSQRFTKAAVSKTAHTLYMCVCVYERALSHQVSMNLLLHSENKQQVESQNISGNR